jgi:hypothetical protein
LTVHANHSISSIKSLLCRGDDDTTLPQSYLKYAPNIKSPLFPHLRKVTSPPLHYYTENRKEFTKEERKMMNPVASYQVGKYRVHDILKDAERRRPLNHIQNVRSGRMQDLLKQFKEHLIIASERLQEWARLQKSNALGQIE